MHETILHFLLINFVAVGIFLFDSFAFLNFWNWFITPLSIIKLTFSHAFGITIFIKFLIAPILFSLNSEKIDKPIKIITDYLTDYVSYVFYLLILGWLAKQFVV